MLFTDSDIVNSADMLQIDSEVASVAATVKPALVLDGPGSICEQTWRECGRKIQAAQQMYTSTLVAYGTSGSHQAAVNQIGGQARNQARTRLNQIVATETQYGNSQSAIQIWMAYTALAMLFRDASSRLGKDRLQEKYDRYLKDAEFSWMQLRNVGLPWLIQPMEAPGARHSVNAGYWTQANVSTVAGSGTAQTLQVAITYYDASRYVSEAQTGNAESGPSDVISVAVPAASVVRVSIASLNPPAGVMDQVGVSQGLWTPLNATHWNIWIGQPGGLLYWQAAVPVATKTYTLAGDPVLTGPTMKQGQWPDLLLTFQNVLGRG